jgi:hypothetical protein
VRHLGVYSPSSRVNRATFVIISALVCSLCKESWTLEKLQASNQWRNQCLFGTLSLVGSSMCDSYIWHHFLKLLFNCKVEISTMDIDLRIP